MAERIFGSSQSAASTSWGVDVEAAAALGVKVIWALSLPGKTSPVTAGQIVADTILGILAEEGDADD